MELKISESHERSFQIKIKYIVTIKMNVIIHKPDSPSEDLPVAVKLSPSIFRYTLSLVGSPNILE